MTVCKIIKPSTAVQDCWCAAELYIQLYRKTLMQMSKVK